MTAAPDLVRGEFVKISVEQQLHPLLAPEPKVHWFFARFISWVDQQAVIEFADGSRNLVQAAQVHHLDVTATETTT